MQTLMMALKRGTTNDLVPVVADENGQIVLASVSKKVGVEVTRPADTTAYSAKDVVSVAAGAALLTFTDLAPVAGQGAAIVRARIMTDKKDCAARFRLHLFHTAPTPIADNSPYTLLYANAANRIGMIDFPAAATEDATNSTAAGAMRPSSDGIYGPPDLFFLPASESATIYGMLETLDAFTPSIGQKFYVELIAVAA